MAPAALGRSMFAGNINRQTVIADHPVLVVDGEMVLSSFTRVQDARLYVEKAHSDTALIFRHNGRNWDVWQDEPRTAA